MDKNEDTLVVVVVSVSLPVDREARDVVVSAVVSIADVVEIFIIVLSAVFSEH